MAMEVLSALQPICASGAVVVAQICAVAQRSRLDSAAAEVARFDREEGPSRRTAGGDAPSHRSHLAGPLRGKPDRQHHGIAGTLRGHAGVARELVVAHRACKQIEQRSSNHPRLGSEDLLSRLAHRAHLELVSENQEGGRLAGKRVARAGEDHPHAAAFADAAPQVRTPRRLLRGMTAAGAEANRPRPPLSRRSGPCAVDPDKSRQRGDQNTEASKSPARHWECTGSAPKRNANLHRRWATEKFSAGSATAAPRVAGDSLNMQPRKETDWRFSRSFGAWRRAKPLRTFRCRASACRYRSSGGSGASRRPRRGSTPSWACSTRRWPSG